MKKYLIAIGLMMLISMFTNASNEVYQAAMKKEIQKLNIAQTSADFQSSANTFGRIAEMNPTEWLPEYYAGLAYANMGYKSQGTIEEKDGLFFEAKKHAEKAHSISPTNSEIVALQGYIIMGELSADPGTRGQSMSPIVMQTFGKAIEMDRQNPRAILMMAQMEYGMAQFFKQGTEKACALLSASVELFEKQAANFTEESLDPAWGKEIAVQMAGSCK